MFFQTLCWQPTSPFISASGNGLGIGSKKWPGAHGDMGHGVAAGGPSTVAPLGVGKNRFVGRSAILFEQKHDDFETCPYHCY